MVGKLLVNPKKTVVVPFTRKRVHTGLQPLLLNGELGRNYFFQKSKVSFQKVQKNGQIKYPKNGGQTVSSKVSRLA